MVVIMDFNHALPGFQEGYVGSGAGCMIYTLLLIAFRHTIRINIPRVNRNIIIKSITYQNGGGYGARKCKSKFYVLFVTTRSTF